MSLLSSLQSTPEAYRRVGVCAGDTVHPLALTGCGSRVAKAHCRGLDVPSRLVTRNPSHGSTLVSADGAARPTSRAAFSRRAAVLRRRAAVLRRRAAVLR